METIIRVEPASSEEAPARESNAEACVHPRPPVMRHEVTWVRGLKRQVYRVMCRDCGATLRRTRRSWL